MKKIKNILYVLILGSISTTILFSAKKFTNAKIKSNQEKSIKQCVLKAAGFNIDSDDIDDMFKNNIKTITENNFSYYTSPEKWKILRFKGQGLWGIIHGFIALDDSLNLIENVQILSQEETPGLGGRISEPEYLITFKNKDISNGLELAVRKKATNNNEIDCISGATLTSNAFINIINNSVKHFQTKMRN